MQCAGPLCWRNFAADVRQRHHPGAHRRDGHLSPRHNSRFGQPAIRLYSGRGFYIEALFWLDASTAIHQHAFSGAIQVIEGGSVHAVYEFEQQERINSHLLVGKLNLCKAEVLRPGDTRPISDGSSFIHALFHLERPSVTLVLRTLQNPDALPQYNYFRPGFAQDPAPYDHLARTQVELLESLGVLGHPEYTRTVCELIRKRDVSLALSVLFDLARREFVLSADRQAIADELGRSFGPLATFLTQAERERSRELKILQLRARIHDPDLRFFLGLVLNVPNAKLIRQLVNERRPAALPVDTLVDWLLRIATKVKGAESVEAETAEGDRY